MRVLLLHYCLCNEKCPLKEGFLIHATELTAVNVAIFHRTVFTPHPYYTMHLFEPCSRQLIRIREWLHAPLPQYDIQ